jgi:DNA repair exonuclease SbcCD ATPase subunit
MRISSLELNQIGPFEQVRLTFPRPTSEGELVIFEGPNGAGKTTLIHALCTCFEKIDSMSQVHQTHV